MLGQPGHMLARARKFKPQNQGTEWLQTLYLTTKEYIFMSIMYETPTNTGYMLRHRANLWSFKEWL